MDKETARQLTITLFKVLKKRKVSVPKLSDELGIPQDRIYKWKQQNSGPGIEDFKKIENWINIQNPGNEDTEFKQVEQKMYSVDYVDLLKETNAMLKDIIKANLTELLTAQRLNRAQLTVITDLGAKTLSAVQKRKLDQVREETNKALGDIVAQQRVNDTVENS